jgi:hypothetical protein
MARLEAAVTAYQAAVSGASGHPILLQLALAGLQRALEALTQRRQGN